MLLHIVIVENVIGMIFIELLSLTRCGITVLLPYEVVNFYFIVKSNGEC
jgi:hypothetical protein